MLASRSQVVAEVAAVGVVIILALGFVAGCPSDIDVIAQEKPTLPGPAPAGGDDDDDVPVAEGEEEPPLPPPPGEGEGEVEGPCTTCYYRDIQPLFERSCHGCHRDGGVAPFPFTLPEDAQAYSPLLLEAIEAGLMPPYFADQDCNQTKHDPRFSDVEKALLRAWVEEGSPLGNAADAVHAADPIEQATIDANVALDIGVEFDVAAHSTSAADVDVYRCFDVDLGFTEDTAITGYEVFPGNIPIVHHLLGYAIPPDGLAELEANDAADDGPGYACEAMGPGISGSIFNLAVSWVPGAGAHQMPPDTGIVVAAGSRLVVQVHYNIQSANGDTVDRTSFALETRSPQGLTPLSIIPATEFELNIPAYEPHVVEENVLGALVDFDVWSYIHGQVFKNTRVFAAAGHMHQLGKSVRLDVLHANGSEECLFAIDDWNFHWQQSYPLAQPFDIQPNDALRITCIYDNSAANQPIIDGVQVEPRDVAWGEGSRDEMCMVYLTFMNL